MLKLSLVVLQLKKIGICELNTDTIIGNFECRMSNVTKYRDHDNTDFIARRSQLVVEVFFCLC